ncbi:hypothetical protein OROHE_006608 [Orobanche hederae]
MSNKASGSMSASGGKSIQFADDNCSLFLEQLDTGVSGTIVVMICRIWDVNATTGRYLSTDFVVCDAKVSLKEGCVYSIKNFIVQPNKDEYRIIREDPFMLEFDGSTTTRKVSANSEGFIGYPFELADLDDIEPTNNKYLIDVAGYVTNVGRTTHQKSGSRTLDFFLANKRGQSIRVTLWGGLGDILIEKKTKHVGLCPVVITALNAKQYNNKLYLSSSSSTVIYENDDIPALIDLKVEMSSVELNKAIVPADFSEPKDGTLENLLIWGRNKRNNYIETTSDSEDEVKSSHQK